MRILILFFLLTLASCRGINGITGSEDPGTGSCGGSIGSVWSDDGGAILDLTHLDLTAPVTSQWVTSSGLYTCQATFIVIGTSCSGTITVTGGSMVSGPAGGFSSQCAGADGTYNYSILAGRLRYGRQGSTEYLYH
jgi:hypothetical protein